ncbi:MAG: O-antigen ligase family protein, partial [Candidatus Andersenbacteria bacterium]|nr:O-antigen ligase family protein [Candidatus Andersenbacteria bacterium]
KFDQIINSGSRSSFHSRLMIWNSAGEIIKDNPLFGIGPGTFQETYLSYAEKFDEPYLEWAVPQPHNVFLAFYLQTGLIGFVGFVLILIWFFNCRNRAMPCFYNIINALMIYILIHGLVDTTYWKNDLALMFWLIIGMMFVKNLAIDPVRNFTKKYTENKLS